MEQQQQQQHVYFFVRDEEKREWVFTRLREEWTTVNMIGLLLETWHVRSGECYKLLACGYSDKEARRFLADYARIKKAEEHHTGPRLYQVILLPGNRVVCEVTKPILMPSLRVQYNEVDFRILPEKVSFDRLKEEIRNLLKIGVMCGVLHREISHTKATS